MSQLLNAIANRWADVKRKKYLSKSNRFIQQYLQENGILDIIKHVDEVSGSTGVNYEDYVSLHSYIRKHQPRYILECGTGKSTWVIAHAVKKNFEETGIKATIVSMEDKKLWYDEAIRNLPQEYKPFVEIVFSPAVLYCYSMFRGTAYASIPDHPYDLIFVDGPDPEFEENGICFDTLNMDLIRYVQQASKPVTAIVDYRLKTVIAYSLIFGKHKTNFLKPWNVGILENITKNDLNIERKDFETLISQVKISSHFAFANPSWI